MLSGPGKSSYLTELLDFFLKSCCILICSRRRGKLSLRSSRRPHAQLFIIKLYSFDRTVLSHSGCLLSTSYYIRLNWSSCYSNRHSLEPLCIPLTLFLLKLVLCMHTTVEHQQARCTVLRLHLLNWSSLGCHVCSHHSELSVAWINSKTPLFLAAYPAFPVCSLLPLALISRLPWNLQRFCFPSFGKSRCALLGAQNQGENERVGQLSSLINNGKGGEEMFVFSKPVSFSRCPSNLSWQNDLISQSTAVSAWLPRVCQSCHHIHSFIWKNNHHSSVVSIRISLYYVSVSADTSYSQQGQPKPTFKPTLLFWLLLQRLSNIKWCHVKTDAKYVALDCGRPWACQDIYMYRYIFIYMSCFFHLTYAISSQNFTYQ